MLNFSQIGEKFKKLKRRKWPNSRTNSGIPWCQSKLYIEI